MLHKRKAKKPAPEEISAEVLGRSDSANLDPAVKAAENVPPPAVAPAELVSAASKIPKPGPGRPATRPHCLRCAKRLERCQCKDGALLAAEISKATEESRARAIAVPLDREEAESILRFMCWALGIAESGAAAILTKLSWDEAEEVYSFSEEDIRALLPPAHKVLAKYAAKLPSWLRDYRDEMALGMALYGVQKQKAAQAAELLAKKENPALLAKKENPAPARPQLVASPASGEKPAERKEAVQ